MTLARRLRNAPWWLLCAFVALVYVYMLAPIAVVLIEAFNDSELLQFPPREYSLRWFYVLASHGDFLNSFRISIVLGLAAAAIATTLGTLAAYGLVRHRRGGQAGLETLLLAPLYVPRVLIGLSLLLALSTIHLTGTFLGMLLAHVLITIPYVIRTVSVSLEGVDPAVEEAARSLGATPVQGFLRVTLPLVRSGLVAGAIFAFIISFSDIYLALFISGPHTVTLPLRMFHFMEWEQTPLIAAVSAVQVILILTLLVVAERAVGFLKAGRI
jgi:putative spermidine/putrescine transport system permease protein